MKAGMSIKAVDTLVRGYIEEKGYGDFFRHGLGHGVGIAVHEAPTINSVSDGILEENMVLTVEPGIYLPNIGGVRLGGHGAYYQRRMLRCSPISERTLSQYKTVMSR